MKQNSMKRVLSLLLTFCMLCSYLPLNLWAEGDSVNENQPSGGVVEEVADEDEENEENDLSPLEQLQALINALPTSVTEDNRDSVIAQLEAIDEAKLLVEDEEGYDSIDWSNYEAAAIALGESYEVEELGETTLSTQISTWSASSGEGWSYSGRTLTLEDLNMNIDSGTAINTDASTIILKGSNTITVTNGAAFSVSNATTIKSEGSGSLTIHCTGNGFNCAVTIEANTVVDFTGATFANDTVVNGGSLTINASGGGIAGTLNATNALVTINSKGAGVSNATTVTGGTLDITSTEGAGISESLTVNGGSVTIESKYNGVTSVTFDSGYLKINSKEGTACSSGVTANAPAFTYTIKDKSGNTTTGNQSNFPKDYWIWSFLELNGSQEQNPTETYTLTLDANGGIFDNDSTKTKKEETKNKDAVVDNLKTTYVPTQSGFTFLGWFTDKNGGTEVTKWTATQNTTLYAHWESENTKDSKDIQVTVEFSTADVGENLSDADKDAWAAAVVPGKNNVNTVTVTCYKERRSQFIRHYVYWDNTSKPISLKTAIQSIIPDGYELTGKWDFDKLTDIKQRDDTTYKDLWEGTDCCKKYYVQLKAKTPETYTVTTNVLPNADTGTLTASKTSELKAGDTVTLTASPKESYVLESLVVKNGETPIATTQNADGTYSFTMPAANVTATASFRGIKLTLDPNGGNWAGSTENKVIILPDGIIPENPSKEGCNFVYWTLKQDGSGEHLTRDTLKLEAKLAKKDLTVYAQWVSKPTAADLADLDAVAIICEYGPQGAFASANLEPEHFETYKFKDLKSTDYSIGEVDVQAAQAYCTVTITESGYKNLTEKFTKEHGLHLYYRTIYTTIQLIHDGEKWTVSAPEARAVEKSSLPSVRISAECLVKPTVKVTWDDDNDYDKLRPDTLEVKLNRVSGSIVIEPKLPSKGDGSLDTKTVKKDDWSAVFAMQPKYRVYENKAEPMVCSVELESVPNGYSVEYKQNGYDFEIVLTHKSSRPSYVVVDGDDEKQEDKVIVKAKWYNDKESDRPNNISVQLLKDGKNYGKAATLSDSKNTSKNWRHVWEDVKEDDDTVWSIKVSGVPSTYTYTIEEVRSNYFVIHCTLKSGKANPETGFGSQPYFCCR